MMQLAGRWVPREFVTELLLLWLVMVIILGVLVYFAWRRKPPDKKTGSPPCPDATAQIRHRRRDRRRHGAKH
jgi:hypothetical protein